MPMMPTLFPRMNEHWFLNKQMINELTYGS